MGDVQKKLARGKVGPLEQQIEFVLGATKTGINILDPDLNVRYIDPDSQKMYGDPTGKKCYEYFKGRSSVCPDCGALKALKTNSIVVSEAVMPKDNNRPVQITSIPFKGQDGQQLLAEVHVDITERKQIEESLKAEKDKAQQYFEVAEVIMVALDIEQKVSMINRKGCEILGHSKEDVIGKYWCDNFVPDNITDIVKSVIAVGLKGQIDHVEYFENPVLTRKGDWKIIAWRNALLYDEKGQINGMLSSGLD
ncbi:MAG: PAS domain S-box protein, partial [Planctomycetes bacterium]|nr:PAS domain S-box protein [Planctomycetota bacterium]